MSVVSLSVWHSRNGERRRKDEPPRVTRLGEANRPKQERVPHERHCLFCAHPPFFPSGPPVVTSADVTSCHHRIAAARRDSALRRRAWGVLSMPALANTGV